MTPRIAKYALVALAIATFMDMKRNWRKVHDRKVKHEALSTWEDEGGTIHTHPAQH